MPGRVSTLNLIGEGETMTVFRRRRENGRRRRWGQARREIQRYAEDAIQELGATATRASVIQRIRERVTDDAGNDRPFLNLLTRAFQWLVDSGLLDALLKAWLGVSLPGLAPGLSAPPAETSEFGAGVFDDAPDEFLDDSEVEAIWAA